MLEVALDSQTNHDMITVLSYFAKRQLLSSNIDSFSNYSILLQ